MNEFELIRRLIPGLPSNTSVVAGAGDDCALLDLGLADEWVLFKTDAVVEGVHWVGDVAPERVGHKALGRCLSDIAAMGGSAVAAVVTVGLPSGYDAEWVERAYAGMRGLAARHGVAIVGGETTTSREGRWFSVAALGRGSKTRTPRRSGARAGDAIFVTGELGGSIEGRHLDFEPRLAEGAWLVGRFEIHSMMDISDGLGGDLRHLLTASGVGAELKGSAVPVSRSARLAARAGAGAKPPLMAALSDGEDFELLFTVAASDAVRVLDGWKAAFPGVRLSCIGRIVEGSGLRIHEPHGVREVNERGYVHFH